ncbi:MAG TPA: alpha/beta fold hydrolase [Steroidobacteraceae bacterium]|nr:alpha/beta fold hydrolase [Steroidobacteraceae bacterium]
MDAAVVYVHGLWMPGAEAVLLARRLRRERGYRLHFFRYASVRQPMEAIAVALRDAIARIEAPAVHLLGHSLGGLVILHCLERYAMRQPGRVVFMGSPVMGSRSAQMLCRWRLGRWLAGRAVASTLLPLRAPRWNLPRELGIIAGTWPLGLGRLLVPLREPNDGVVTVSETRLPGAKARLDLRVNHMGLLWSAAAAREAGSFLEHGRFGL